MLRCAPIGRLLNAIFPFWTQKTAVLNGARSNYFPGPQRQNGAFCSGTHPTTPHPTPPLSQVARGLRRLARPGLSSWAPPTATASCRLRHPPCREAAALGPCPSAAGHPAGEERRPRALHTLQRWWLGRSRWRRAGHRRSSSLGRLRPSQRAGHNGQASTGPAHDAMAKNGGHRGGLGSGRSRPVLI